MTDAKKVIKDCFDGLAEKVKEIQSKEIVEAAGKSLASNPIIIDRAKLDPEVRVLPYHIPNVNGIYYFEVQIEGLDSHSTKELHDFCRAWNREKSDQLGDYFRTRAYRGQINSLAAAGTKPLDWIPFYLGKANNLQSRIFEHVVHPTNERTWALRLGHAMNSVDRIKAIRVSFLELDLDSVSYSFAGHLEKELRRHFHPIMGKQ